MNIQCFFDAFANIIHSWTSSGLWRFPSLVSVFVETEVIALILAIVLFANSSDLLIAPLDNFSKGQ